MNPPVKTRYLATFNDVILASFFFNTIFQVKSSLKSFSYKLSPPFGPSFSSFLFLFPGEIKKKILTLNTNWKVHLMSFTSLRLKLYIYINLYVFPPRKLFWFKLKTLQKIFCYLSISFVRKSPHLVIFSSCPCMIRYVLKYLLKRRQKEDKERTVCKQQQSRLQSGPFFLLR